MEYFHLDLTIISKIMQLHESFRVQRRNIECKYQRALVNEE